MHVNDEQSLEICILCLLQMIVGASKMESATGIYNFNIQLHQILHKNKNAKILQKLECYFCENVEKYKKVGLLGLKEGEATSQIRMLPN